MADAPRDTSWIGIQKRTFTRWVNQHLSDRTMKIEDLTTDLADGLALINLLEIISDKKIPSYNKRAKIRPQMLENNSFALNFLKNEGIKLVAIGPEDIVDKQPKLILGLIWTIILRYQIQKGDGSSSAKNELLEWVRRQIPECNIQNFTTSWNDGKAICHLADSLKRGIIDVPAVDNNPNALANAELGEDTAERELGIPKVLLPEDMVSPQPDELSVMTYISYYRDYAENEAKRRGQEALEKIAVPEKSYAHGAGLTEGEQFIPAEFTIQAKNQFGRDVPVGGDTFDVKITNPKGTPVSNKVTDNGNGTYTVNYTPLDSGRHSVAIQLKGKQISGSPYHVPIERTSVAAHGPGLEKGEQYLTSEFSVNARRLHDAGVEIPPGELSIKINSPKAAIEPTVKENGDGTYDVTYLPTEAGRHTITITLYNRPIANGPFSVVVDKTACTASGPGLEKAEQFIPAEFTIQAKNLFASGNPATPADFDVKISGPKGNVQPNIVDNNDGTYSVTYTPVDTGRHQIAVSLKGHPISNGPFSVPVDRTSTTASGPGLEGGEQFVPAVFSIKAPALFNSGSPLQANEIDVKVAAPGGPLEPTIVDNNDGTFTVTYNPIDAGRHNVTVAVKGQPIAQASVPINKSSITVSGPGLERGEAFIPSNFQINAKPLHEKGVAPDANEFDVVVAGPEGNVPAEVKDNGDGTYDVTYTPVAPGRHNVGLALKKKPLFNTSVPVDKSATDAGKSTASGPGLEPGNIVDVPTHFTIQARNKAGEPMKTGGDSFLVKIAGPHNSEVEFKYTDNKDGTYLVNYEPHLVGTHKVSITLRDQGIVGNPWTVEVGRAGDSADPSQCVAYGPGLEGGDTADPSSFTVETRNSSGERLNRGGDPIGVEVFGPDGVEAKVTLTDNNDGTYSVVYQAVNPGKHQVDVVLRNKKYPLYYDHIKDSPFTVPITAGTDAGKSLVYGPGLEDAYDTKPAVFHIKARDRDGKDMGRGGDPFEVVVTGPSGQVPSNIKDNEDGTYDVVYEPMDHGDHKIEVKLRNKPVANSPYKVAVKEGADYRNTFVEQYSFVIRSQTKHNKPKTFGGESFQVKITDSNGNEAPVTVRDIGDGTYVVSYSLPQPGDWSITVKINDQHIRGSPWRQVQQS